MMRSNSARLSTERPQMARLDVVVELVHQRLAELANHRRELVPAADRRVAIDERGDLVERIEIRFHLLDDAGPLHFDRDRPAVAKRGAMHLSERAEASG